LLRRNLAEPRSILADAPSPLADLQLRVAVRLSPFAMSPFAIVAVRVRAYTAPMTEQPAAAGAPPVPPADPDCPRCLKPPALCVCEGIARIDNKVSLLILQHPQEQDRELGTARLTVLHFKDALIKIGLSWPSLSKILGRTTDPQRWAILYLGSVKAAALLPDRDVVVVNRNGNAVDHQDQALREIEGIILLDGTWSQAKALWWRNAWMLKCKRVVLGPKLPSRYGKLRREPRGDGLSTIEAAAMLMARLERKPEIETALHASFERLLGRYRAAHPSAGARRRR
jgi:DTW domain-containing protein